MLNAGWQKAFLVVGVSGFLWLGVWLLTYHTPKEAAVEAAGPAPAVWPLFRQRFVWSLTLAKVFFDPVWYFYIFWFPQYLSSARGFDLARIGLVAWIPFLTADIGNLAGGAFSAMLLRRGVSLAATRKASLIFFPALMTAAIPAVLAPDARVAVAFVSLATFGYTGCSANLLALPADHFPKNSLGSIWGLASMGSGFGGMLFSLATGWLVSRFSYTPVFIGFGLLPLVASAILVLVTCGRSTRGPLTA